MWVFPILISSSYLPILSGHGQSLSSSLLDKYNYFMIIHIENDSTLIYRILRWFFSSLLKLYYWRRLPFWLKRHFYSSSCWHISICHLVWTRIPKTHVRIFLCVRRCYYKRMDIFMTAVKIMYKITSISQRIPLLHCFQPFQFRMKDIKNNYNIK